MKINMHGDRKRKKSYRIPQDQERGWRFEIWSKSARPEDDRIGFKIRNPDLCMRYLKHLDIVGMQYDEEDKLIFITDNPENRYLNEENWHVIEMACHVGRMIEEYLEGHAEHGNWVMLSPQETSDEDIQRVLPELIKNAYDAYTDQVDDFSASQIFEADKMLVLLSNFGVSYYKNHPGGPHTDVTGEKISWADFEERIVRQINDGLRPKPPPHNYDLF